MKQIVQYLKSGETRLDEMPVPKVQPGQVLIRTTRSLVSLGTERMLVTFSKASLLEKARQQPERVKQVVNKLKSDGIGPTLETVFRKLDQPLPMGYCHVGQVIAIGEGVTDLRIGDRVASNGPHAEVVCVPRSLVAPVPDSVSDDDAAFTVVGSIGLQGIRLLNPTLNETVVVVGLGLIGQLTAQLLRINGCRVIGIDIDEQKCQLAAQQGITTIRATQAHNPVQAVLDLTNQVGADGVIITASASSDELMAQAAQMSRRRGRIVLVGVVGLHLNRADFYEKELTFQVSCSYGPGRYDSAYEQQGQDYPLPYVRWTANRNFQTILQLLERGQLVVQPLITERLPLANCAEVYAQVQATNRIATLFTYPESVAIHPTVLLPTHTLGQRVQNIGIIGAGNYTEAVLLPTLKAVGAIPKTIASIGGFKATLLARKYGIARSTTDYGEILDDPAIDLCLITTRHNSHAQLTIDALEAGKHVFVEKPLAIYAHELPKIVAAQQASGRMLMVGFNRRFSPYVQKMNALLGKIDAPINVVVTVNAGAVAPSSWVHDRTIGGGRILGEGCHFVDLISCLTGSRVQQVCMNAMGGQPAETSDSASLLLRYANGSTGVINYFSNGSKAYAKERVEVYSQNRTLILDNFRSLTGYGFRGFTRLTGRQDKGHTAVIREVMASLRAKEGNITEPIRLADLVNTTQTMLAALQSLHQRSWVDVASIGWVAEPNPIAVLS